VVVTVAYCTSVISKQCNLEMSERVRRRRAGRGVVELLYTGVDGRRRRAAPVVVDSRFFQHESSNACVRAVPVRNGPLLIF
jgi:hypothetical protein